MNLKIHEIIKEHDEELKRVTDEMTMTQAIIHINNFDLELQARINFRESKDCLSCANLCPWSEAGQICDEYKQEDDAYGVENYEE